MSKFCKGIELLLSLPKSFYVSWRLTSFKQAFKLPILCRFNTKLLCTSGTLTGGGNLHIGFNRTGIYDAHYQRAIMSVRGRVMLNGNLRLGAGSRLEVGENGVLVTKGPVYNSDGLTIICHDRIEIGAKTEISWDTIIIDKDFHYIFDIEKGETRIDHKPIIIGEGAWICTGSKVLKGAVLPNGCILGAGAILNKCIDEPNCLLIGNPASVVKRGVTLSNKEIFAK